MKLLLQQISSPYISELFARSQFDGVMIDHEHGCFNDESLFSSIQVITLLKKKVFVRLTDFDKRIVRLCLDAGVTGLIFSTVESLEYAKAIVDFSHYPPRGRRGQGLVRENNWGADGLGNYTPLLIAQIETKTGVDNLDAIMQAGFDRYLIGPYDLSASLGHPGNFTHPDYLAYQQKVITTVGKENLGIFCVKSKDVLTQYPKYKDDFGFFVLGMDSTFILESIETIEKEVF